MNNDPSAQAEFLAATPGPTPPPVIPKSVRVSFSHDNLLSIYGPRTLIGERYLPRIDKRGEGDGMELVVVLVPHERGNVFGNYLKDHDEVRLTCNMTDCDFMPACGPTSALMERMEGADGWKIELPHDLEPARAKRKPKPNYSPEERLVAALAVVNECVVQLPNVRLKVDDQRVVRAFTERTQLVELKLETSDDDAV